MPTARVIVDDRFHKLSLQYGRAVDLSLGQAAAATIATIRSSPTEYQIGGVLDSFKATPAHPTRKGKRIIVYSEDPKAIWFNWGTYARRRKRLSSHYRRTEKAAEIAAERGSGVKAQNFLARALRVGRLALDASLNRELR